MSGIALTNQNGGITPVNPDIEFVQGNDGIPVPPNPTTHIILLLGDNTQGVDLSGNAGAYTETITMFDATESQKGVVLLASNAETVNGSNTTKATTPDDIKAKLGAQTLHGIPYGNATTGAVQWLAEATDGQIPIGKTGAAPVLANITSNDGSINITNGPGTIDLSVAHEVADTATTTDATTADLLTIDLGMVAGTFQIEARVKAFESTTPAGAGYNLYATYRTNGSVATLIGQQPVFNEDATLVDADAYFTTDGSNNAILQVLGVNTFTINWAGEAEIT
jgi:hypothetical protein